MSYEFPYDPNAKKYSCLFSGGADSSLLLYYLLKSGKPVDVYTTAAKDPHMKKRVAQLAIDVSLRCMEITNNYQVNHIISYSNKRNERDLKENVLPFFVSGHLDSIWTGITADPPENEMILPSHETDDRDPNVTRSTNPNPWVHTPFTNHDKKWIAERYKEEGLLETLFPITNSCDDSRDNAIHCGECWWCEEREWGFKHVCN